MPIRGLTDGVVDPAGSSHSELEIVDYLEMIRADGVLILRYIAGYSSSSLSKSAVDGSNCRRCEDAVVEHFLDAFTP